MQAASNRNQFITATIASGASTTGVIDLQGNRLVGVLFPAAMTGTALTVKVDSDGTLSMVALAQAGEDVTITATVDRVEWADPSIFGGFNTIELVSDDTEAAERELVLIVDRY